MRRKLKEAMRKKELDSCKLNFEKGESKLKLARKGRYILAANQKDKTPRRVLLCTWM